MSADSSDCQPSSSASLDGDKSSSVICQAQAQVAQVAPSSTTSNAQLLVAGRSHLENALKLPPNTSVSTYYQHSKLIVAPQQQQQQQSQQQQLQQQQQQQSVGGNSNSAVIFQTEFHQRQVTPVTEMDTVPPAGVSVASKMPHSNVIYVNKSSSSLVVSTSEAARLPQQALPQQPDFEGAAAAAAAHAHAQHMAAMYHHQKATEAAVAPLGFPSSAQVHHHHHHLAAVGSAAGGGGQPNGSIVVMPADSRPQTPEYIKSYPVMDTTVASSVKGEPELNIGKSHTGTHSGSGASAVAAFMSHWHQPVIG